MQPKNIMGDRMITANEVALMVGVSTYTIYQWRKQGKLPPAASMNGKHLRWWMSEVVDWIAETTVEEDEGV